MRTQLTFVSRSERNRKWDHVQRLDFRSFDNLKKIAADPTMPLDSGSWFAFTLAIHFPEVALCVDEDDYGVLHLEMGRLMLASRNAIFSRDWNTLSRHFAFIAAIMDNAGPELLDAIDVSYLSNLMHDEASINYAKARTLLPRPLLHRLELLERHYSHLQAH